MGVLNRYLDNESATADAWEEAKHHRSDNGRFASGSGRGKKAEPDNKANETKNVGSPADDGKRAEMSEARATGIVRAAFRSANKPIRDLTMEGRGMRAEVEEADADSLAKINEYLHKRGLKAKVTGKTSYRIAEDGYDDIQIVDEPMLEVLIDLCRIEMLAKDLHYRADGKAFYGIHLLADLVKDVTDDADDINEVYYMGERQETPPERSLVAAKAAEMVGEAGEMDALLRGLYAVCGETATAVENAKKRGVSGGTSSVLDDISKKALQAKALLARTIRCADGDKVIERTVAKGLRFV